MTLSVPSKSVNSPAPRTVEAAAASTLAPAAIAILTAVQGCNGFRRCSRAGEDDQRVTLRQATGVAGFSLPAGQVPTGRTFAH